MNQTIIKSLGFTKTKVTESIEGKFRDYYELGYLYTSSNPINRLFVREFEYLSDRDRYNCYVYIFKYRARWMVMIDSYEEKSAVKLKNAEQLTKEGTWFSHFVNNPVPEGW